MKKLLPALLVLLLAFPSCKKERTPEPGSKNQPLVTVTGISPATVTSGTIVTISGSNFGISTTAVSVVFNGVAGTVQSVTATEIKVTVPVTTNGNVIVTVGSQTITGPAFTYMAPDLLVPYVSGNVTLTSQADVDAFVALNKGRQLQISGDLAIGGSSTSDSDINNASGLSNITSVSGTLSTYGCPQLSDFSFLDNITSAGRISFAIGGAVTTITMDKLKTTASLGLGSALKLKKLSFKSLTAVSGPVTITSCPQLSDINFSALTSVSGKLSLTSVNITDLSSFSSLQSLGSLSLVGNSALVNLYGLEHLTTLSSPAIDNASQSLFISFRLGGIWISNNPKLTSLTGLQNITSVPVIFIGTNNVLSDFCPLKAPIIAASKLPAYPYTYNYTKDGQSYQQSLVYPALTLTYNSTIGTTQSALAAVALCQ